jgi:uncharacterized protein (TIGR03437 family)
MAVSAGGGPPPPYYPYPFGHSLALKRDGTVWQWGCDGEALVQSTPVQVKDLTGVVAIGAGAEDSIALKGDGTVWAWGWNGWGELGDGTTLRRRIPVQVKDLIAVMAVAAGNHNFLAVKSDATLLAWGWNGSGQLGDGTTTNRSTPIEVKGLPSVWLEPMVVNAASFLMGPIAPGEIVSIFANGIGPPDGLSARANSAGMFENTLGQTRILFDGVAAPLLFARTDLVNAVVPYALAGKRSTEVEVEYQGVRTVAQTLPVAESVPGIFSVGANGSSQGVVLNEDLSRNSVSNPARIGSIVTLFATGEGQTSPPGVDGKVAAGSTPRPVLQVSVEIGNQQAAVVDADSAPGFVAGVLRVKARIPETVSPGAAVPITLVIGQARSQEGVTIAVALAKPAVTAATPNPAVIGAGGGS